LSRRTEENHEIFLKQMVSWLRLEPCNQINVTDVHVQTADDLVPLLGDMDVKEGASTVTLVSRGGQLQSAAKLPQYIAAVSGNVECYGVTVHDSY
jgi:hypothetical protein